MRNRGERCLIKNQEDFQTVSTIQEKNDHDDLQESVDYFKNLIGNVADVLFGDDCEDEKVENR